MKEISPEILSKLESKINNILPEVIMLRHKLHQNPEVGLETYNTSKLIKSFLKKAKLDYWKPLIGADLVAEIKGKADKTICLRADMDGLPLEEKNDVEYKSLINGKMHACGHDGHAAILAGTAIVLNSLKDYLPVNVRLIFQPGEELAGGGKAMVENGVCDESYAAYALHAVPGQAAGTICCKVGLLFVACSFFDINIKGISTHGAYPNKGLNPIPIAARVVSEISKLHEKYNANGSIISVCSMQAGTNSNIIPDNAIIKGTTRFLSTEMGDIIESDIRKIVSDICSNEGVEFSIDYNNSYDTPVINTKAGYELIKNIARRYLPDYMWHKIETHSMGAEDFAFLLKGRDGAMFLVGNGEDSSQYHSSNFDFNDDAIYNGILTFCLIALLQ